MSEQEVKSFFAQVNELVAQQKYEKAIELLKSIAKDPSVESHARAQVGLGRLYKQQGDYEQAESIYKNISKDDSNEWYVRSLIHLAFLYSEQSKFKQAEKTLKSVLKEDDIEQYARAQMELGYLYQQQSDYEQAEYFYKKIYKEDSKKWFAWGRNNLANLYREQKKFEQAETTFKSVLRKDDAEQYARAQVGLGFLYKQQGDYEQAESIYKGIAQEDSGEWYAKAQWNLYVFKDDKKFLENIKIEHGSEVFGKAQFVLGSDFNNLVDSCRHWQRIPVNTTTYTNQKYMIDLASKILEIKSKKHQEDLFKTLKITNNILKNIFVDTHDEGTIAHYTNVVVSKLLLSYQEDKITQVSQVKSPLRLNTINLMNDPVEGRLLHQFLGLNQDNENLIKEAKNQAFIACFTLHHDSLNQFRLYGKHQNQEASGLSLVLNKAFFSGMHNAASIYKHSGISESGLKGQMIDSVEQPNDQQRETLPKQGEKNEPFNRIKGLPKRPLYRCIYLDPVSNYIKVAQREEWSFCREDEHHLSDRWGSYQEKIAEIEVITRDLLASLSKTIHKIKLNQAEDEVSQLVSEILRPLKYLIKHMAFKEEQECRMVYVTKLDDELVKFDEGSNRVYIDYGPSVMEHLEKIYLAPKAKDEQIVFEYLCNQAKKIGLNKNGVKVNISQNPFR